MLLWVVCWTLMQLQCTYVSYAGSLDKRKAFAASCLCCWGLVVLCNRQRTHMLNCLLQLVPGCRATVCHASVTHMRVVFHPRSCITTVFGTHKQRCFYVRRGGGSNDCNVWGGQVTTLHLCGTLHCASSTQAVHCFYVE
jgi:hypothetical protein